MRLIIAVYVLISSGVVSQSDEALKPVEKKDELLAVMVQACAYARCGNLSALASVVCDGTPSLYKVNDPQVWRYIIEKRQKKTVEAYIKEGFPFADLMLSRFREIKMSEARLASDDVPVFKHEWQGEEKDVKRVELKGSRYVMKIELPGGKRYEASFVKVGERIYWEPFGW